jgi:hypothetical protein
MIKAVCRLSEIRFAGRSDVAERLGIAVEEGEPRALDLDHDPMPLEKGVLNVGQLEFDLGHAARDERRHLIVPSSSSALSTIVSFGEKSIGGPRV